MAIDKYTFKQNCINKAIKATLPLIAMMGGGGALASTLNHSTSRRQSPYSVVVVKGANVGGQIASNLISKEKNHQIPNTEANSKQGSNITTKRSAFAAFSNKKSKVNTPLNLKTQTAALNFLKDNNLLSSNKKVSAELSGDTEGRKIFAHTLVFTPFTSGNTLCPNPNHVRWTFQMFTNSASMSCTIRNAGDVSTSFGAGLAQCQAIHNVCAHSNTAPTLTGAPASVTVTEDAASDVNLSAVTLADTDGDNLTFTLTANAGTLAASSGGSVTVGGSGTGTMTLSGTAANINTYLDTTTNIQYTTAANDTTARNIAIKANDGTVDSATSNVTVNITSIADITSDSVPANSTYGNAANLDFTLTFDESVTVSGTPRIALNIGGATKYATFNTGNATATSGTILTFRYVVEAGLLDLDGIGVTNAVDLNAGSIVDTDLDGSGADLSNVSFASTAGVLVNSADSDGNLTSAAGVTEPVNLPWSVDTVGEAVNLFDFTLTDGGGSDGLAMAVSNIVVNVTGTSNDTDRAKVTWRLNGNDAVNVIGTYNGGGNTITFSGLSISVADGASEVYTINGYYNDNSGLTNGNTIILALDGDTNLTIGGSGTQMGATSVVNNGSGTVIADDFSPVVTSVNVPANLTYATATNLDFTVNFDENVTANLGGGTPRLSLTIGATGRFADYISGSGTTALVFRESVVAGDQDLDGISLGATIDLNSGTLRDGAGNDINTTLNSVGPLTSVLVDALAPVVAEVTPVVTPDNDSTPNVTISSTEAGTLAVGGSCGSGSEGAIGSGNSTITLTQIDNATPLTSGTYSNCTATITDSVGNVSNILTLTSFVIDVTEPTVDTNAGKSLDEGDTGIIISNTDLSSSDNVSAAAGTTYTMVGVPVRGTLRNGGGAMAGGGTFTQANINSNAITYDHDDSETTSDTFTFTISDGAGNVNDNGSANFTFNFTIAPVNDAPNTTADSGTTNEDTAVMVDVLVNDSDPDGTLVTSSVVVVSLPANGATAVNPGTGVITYTPGANYNGSDSFEYTVEDNNGLPSVATMVSITINPQNDAPVAVADTANTPSSTLVSIDVANNDTDIDVGDSPDPATILVVGAATNGTAVFNAGTNQVDYTPTGSFIGVDSFTYTIQDGFAATSNVATVTVTVVDPTAPTLAEVTPVPTPTDNTTPNVTFSTDEAGTMTIGGSCGSSSSNAVILGDNTIVLTQSDNVTALTVGVYSDCTVTVTDSSANASGPLTLSSFTINNLPTASSVSITDTNGGSLVVGDGLIGNYTYGDDDGDVEGTSTFRWLRNGVAISGATAISYTLTTTDIGASIQFEVTPVANSGVLSGVAAVSTASGLVISGVIVAVPITNPFMLALLAGVFGLLGMNWMRLRGRSKSAVK